MSPPMTRRAFLTWLGAIVGLGAVGMVWAAQRDDSVDTALRPSTTTGSPTTEPTTNTSAPTSTSTSRPPSTTTTDVAPALPAITVISRGAWGAVPPGPGRIEHTIERLTVHHTARVLVDNREAPAVLRDWQQFHRNEGWPDLAYHYTIDGNGHVYEGRDTRFVGDTRTDYDPTGHFLVALEGNFEEQDPSPAQIEALVALLAWAAGMFDAGPDTIAGHLEYAATACPGTALQARIDDGSLRAAVIASGPQTLSRLPLADGVALVASIEAGTD